MKKNTKQTENQHRAAFRNRIQKSNGNKLIITEARNKLPTNLFDESVEWMVKQLKISLPLKNPFPKEFRSLIVNRPLDPISFPREIAWISAMLKAFSEKINVFVQHKENIELLLLQGDNASLKSELQEIKDNFGVSFWWIEHSIAVKQLFEGIESQKKFITEIKSFFTPKSITRYIVNQMSVRNEPSVTFARFSSQLRNNIDELKLEDGWKKIIKYHVLEKWPISLAGSIEVLQYASTESIIDAYEAFIYLAKNIASQNGLVNESKILVKNLISLNKKINDTRIESLILSLTGGEDGKLVTYDLNSYKSYFISSKEESLSLLLSDPININNYIRYVSESKHEDTTISGVLCHRLAGYFSNILKKEGNVDFGISELNKLSLIFPGIDIISVIQAISLGDMFSGLSDVATSEETNSIFEETDSLLKFAFASKLELNPLVFKFLPIELKNSIIKHSVQNQCLPIHHFPWLHEFVDKTSSFLNLENIIEEAQHYWMLKDYQLVVSCEERAAGTNNKMYQMALLRFSTYSLIKLGLFKDCIDRVAKEYINNNNSRYVLPIIELTDKIDKAMRREIGHELSLPILYNIYQKHFDKAYDSAYSQSVISVLRKNSVHKPSELKQISHSYDTLSLIYFLRYCCLPDVYRKTGAFENTKDLYTERIAILDWLIELDVNNSEAYKLEIINLTRKIVLMARRAEVEQSRIELNIESFLREAEKSTKENYDRYVAIRRVNVMPSASDNVQNDNTDASVPLLSITEPKDEASDLFLNILKDLILAFIGDLDKFLSTRIRHTVLESELLSPLVNSYLVTLRDGQEQYKFHEYWLKDIKVKDAITADKINSALVEFDSAYDQLVQLIKNQWVHIRFGKNNKGLIEFNLNIFKAEKMEEIIGRLYLPFPSFASAMFQIFTTELEPGLDKIRRHLNVTGKNRALSLVDKLEKELKLIDDTPIDLLNAVRDVRASILRAFDLVISWFKLGYESSNEPLALDHVIEISTEIMRHYNPRFVANINLNSASNVLVSGLLINSYIDVFINVFNNVMTRAGLGDYPLADVSGIISDDKVRIKVKNKIGKDIQLSDTRLIVDEIMLKINSDSYKANLRREGGTGLIRIFDTIRSLRIDPNLKIKVKDERIFTVSFNLPTS